MRSLLLTTAAVFVLAACDPATETPTNTTETTTPAVTETAATEESIAEESARLNAWFDEKYEEVLQNSPMSMTQLGRKDRYDEIDDMSFEAQREQIDWRLATVDEMKSNFDYDLLDQEAKTSYDLWIYNAERAEASWDWRFHSYNFEQMGGSQAWIPQFLINFHKVDTEEDMVAYISRVSESARAIRQLLEQTQQSAEKGIRAPTFAYEGAIQQAKNVITGAPFTDGDDSALYADLKSEITTLEEAGNVTPERAEELMADAETALIEDFGPAYQAVIDWMSDDIENTAAETVAGDLPDGAAFYNYRLASSTTTDLTADEIHEIGLSEVARLREQMVAVKDSFGFEGSLEEFFVFLRENTDDERLYYPNTDEGRQGYIDDATADIENIKQHLPEYFGILPKADVIVKRVEPFREQAGAAQHYNSGTPDGSRPGIYYAHLLDMKAMPKRELEVIAYHEAIPGHHMQISIAQELTGIPQFRTQQFFNAYVEGWALYSEYLAKEMPGTYEDDLSEFGRLGSEIWRAIRLVVDTGLHAKGWTKQEAIDYFQANSAITDAQALAEVERYITWPGQATGYKIGMLKILELREKAKTELGDDFDIRGFHDAVLGGGGLPLEVLEHRIEAWIASVKDGTYVPAPMPTETSEPTDVTEDEPAE